MTIPAAAGLHRDRGHASAGNRPKRPLRRGTARANATRGTRGVPLLAEPATGTRWRPRVLLSAACGWCLCLQVAGEPGHEAARGQPHAERHDTVVQAGNDQGAALRPVDRDAEGDLGLRLVAGMAAWRGWRGVADGR
jgi:hypothetical protein